MHTLAGAYALDALPELERARFERHLGSCEICRDEVEEFQATTSRLGSAAAQPPPPGLRDRVLAEIDVTRQQSPQAPAPRPRSGARRWLRVLSPVAAAAAAVVITLAVIGGPAPTDEMPMDDMYAVLSAPDARAVPLETTGTLQASVIAAPSTGHALLTLTDLDTLEGGEAYVLWTYRDGSPNREQPLRAGEMMVMLENVGQVSEVVVTIEPDPDDTRPSGPMVARAALG